MINNYIKLINGFTKVKILVYDSKGKISNKCQDIMFASGDVLRLTSNVDHATLITDNKEFDDYVVKGIDLDITFYDPNYYHDNGSCAECENNGSSVVSRFD